MFRSQSVHVLCTPEEQFDAFAKVMAAEWTMLEGKNGGPKVGTTDWLLTEYCTAPYNVWWVGASGTPGVLPNNNPIESKQDKSSNQVEPLGIHREDAERRTAPVLSTRWQEFDGFIPLRRYGHCLRR